MLQLGEGVWLIRPLAPPRYPYGNCMYIEDERAAVIDLGAGSKAFAALPCERVQLGLISHFHFDHTHGDRLFSRAAFYAGWQEAKAYYDQETYLQFFGFHLWEKIMPGVKLVPFSDATGIIVEEQVGPGFRKFNLAGTFKDMEHIDLGRREIIAIHLPGHTSGHYGFYFEKEGILFSGDLDFVSSGPWYYGESSDVGELIASLQRIKEIGPGTIVPSHRRILTGEEIEKHLVRYLQVLLEREEKILNCLQKHPHTLEQLAMCGIAFPQPSHIYEAFWERMAIRNHLRKLKQEGRVKETEEGYYFLN